MIDAKSSLILSWLKHVKGCQIVLPNWNPSLPNDVNYNGEAIDILISEIIDYFQSQYELYLFSDKQDCLDLLRENSIDVIGLRLYKGMVEDTYAVNFAFNDKGAGLDQGNRYLERVLERMVISAMTLYGSLDNHKGRVIFASPQIQVSVHAELIKYTYELNIIMNKSGFEFAFDLWANESFKDNILEPVLEVLKNLDSSDIFINTIQLYQSFKGKRSKSTKFRSVKVKSSLDDVKIGELVRIELGYLIEKGLISDDVTKLLQEKDYCKNVFDINYPFLKEVERGIKLERQVNGYPRYWKNPIDIKGKKFWVCKDWYDRNRPYFEKWLETEKTKLPNGDYETQDSPSQMKFDFEN
jgi:hypothetical protein